jgi:hypothetical protein
MLQAATLGPDDARLILARRASEMLEGGRVARLSPAGRQVLDRLATRLGVRAFDASLVIAIAQDAARNGESVESRSVGGRLAMTRGAAREARREWLWPSMAAAGLAVAIFTFLIRWIGGN